MADTGVLRVVFGDQLSRKIAALRELDRERDSVLLMEVREESEAVPSHRQRNALFLAAMRHFSAALAARKVKVEHVRLDDPANTQSFDGEVACAVERLKPERIVVTWPGEWRVLEMVRGWESAWACRSKFWKTTASSLRARISPPGPRERRLCGWSSSIARCAAATGC